MENSLTEALIVFLASAASVCAALAAYLKSRTEVQNVKKDREATKQQRDTEIALLKAELENQRKQLKEYKTDTDKRLTEGDVVMKGFTEQFSVLNGNVSFIRGLLEGRDQYDRQLKETNKNITDLIGVMRSSTRSSGHTPESRPM